MADGGSSLTTGSRPGPTAGADGPVVGAAARGDVQAFEQLYRQYSGRVHGLCLRLVRGDTMAAEDCTQEAFVRAWKALGRFEARSSFGTWMHRIAVNVVLERRRRPSERELPQLPADDSAEHGEIGDDFWSFDTPVEEREIEAAIASLPAGARDALVLCGIHGYTHEEAAAMLGVAAGTCKAQLHRARALVRERIERGVR